MIFAIIKLYMKFFQQKLIIFAEKGGNLGVGRDFFYIAGDT